MLINIINNKGKHTIQQFTYEQVKQNLECSNKSNNMLTGQEHQADRHGYSGKLNMTIQSLHFFLATTLKLSPREIEEKERIGKCIKMLKKASHF